MQIAVFGKHKFIFELLLPLEASSMIAEQHKLFCYFVLRAKLQHTLKGDILDSVSSGLLAKLVSEVSDLRCDFAAIIDTCNGADVQDFSQKGYKAAGVEIANEISDDEKLGQVSDQSEQSACQPQLGACWQFC